MIIKQGIEYYNEYELADLLQVRYKEIRNWYYDGVLGDPTREFEDRCLRWTRSQVEEIIGHGIPDYAREFYNWRVIYE